MKRYSYGERDYRFGQAMLSLRTRTGLTQAGLAKLLGVSRRAVVEWEAGSNYPTAGHLQHFLELCVQQRVFAPGREEEEIRALWQAAHQKVLLDDAWLTALLGRRRSSLTLLHPEPQEAPRPGDLPQLSQRLRHNWIGGRRWMCPASMDASRNWSRSPSGWSRNAAGW